MDNRRRQGRGRSWSGRLYSLCSVQLGAVLSADEGTPSLIPGTTCREGIKECCSKLASAWVIKRSLHQNMMILYVGPQYCLLTNVF